ncbi:MAG: glycerol-3-phosphate dehydrogenase [Pseudomonadota bacterium]
MENVDVLIIGGGVNGAGIARDLAGRGLSVRLCEKGDLGGATSSNSTKLFHGGLRYLEFFEFKMVREALLEREYLLKAMPHISWPLRFVLPVDELMVHPNARSATSRVLRWTLPWLRGKRPAWVIRTGLFLYDLLASNSSLPRTKRVDLKSGAEGDVLKSKFTSGLEYSDGWVDDARLVIANCRAAEAAGAQICPRTAVVNATVSGDLWDVSLADGERLRARLIVNAAGPWVSETLRKTFGVNDPKKMRLVRGSHIVTPKLYDHDKAYFLQQPDGRIIFAIPYEDEFTLIGTTEVDHNDDPRTAKCSPAERTYLLDAVNLYFRQAVSEDDIVWTYSGVRPLVEEATETVTSTSRDYELFMSQEIGAPLLNVFGGKITTYRHLAEEAGNMICLQFRHPIPPWTRGVRLPGGDFEREDVDTLERQLRTQYPFLNADWAKRLMRMYGTDAWDLLGDAASLEDLGKQFGATLTEREVAWMRDREWAKTAEDVLWRRSKLGLHGARITDDDVVAAKQVEDARYVPSV